jgi:hypothetical protein
VAELLEKYIREWKRWGDDCYLTGTQGDRI